jgi:hypothetical protein
MAPIRVTYGKACTDGFINDNDKEWLESYRVYISPLGVVSQFDEAALVITIDIDVNGRVDIPPPISFCLPDRHRRGFHETVSPYDPNSKPYATIQLTGHLTAKGSSLKISLQLATSTSNSR